MTEMTEYEQISLELSPYLFGGLGFCSYISLILFYFFHLLLGNNSTI